MVRRPRDGTAGPNGWDQMLDVDIIGAPAFAVDVAGDAFVYRGVNRRMAELIGVQPGDIVGRRPDDCWPAEVAEALVARYRQCVSARHAVDSDSYYDPAGGGRWWHVTLTPVFDGDGGVAALVGLATDVSDRQRAERDRREAEIRMGLAMDALDGGFWHLDIASDAVEVSPKLSALLVGRIADRMSWDAFTAGIHADDRAGIDIRPMVGGACEAATVEYRALDGATGETRWFRSRRRLVRSETGAPEGIIGVVLDITDQKRLQTVYERQARTDPLTGLANRRGFEGSAGRFLHAERSGGQRFGLVLLDLDRFKPINDRFGHATGDTVLCEIADRLTGLVRPDDVVARLGGDEFAILVADIAHGALAQLAQRLVLAAQRPVPTPVGDLSVGVSVGIATSVDGDDLGALSGRADRALYEVKLSGRGTWKLAA